MEIDVRETGPVERRLRVEVPTAEVDTAFDEAFRKLGQTAQVRGFRQGRVPRPVLERILGDRAREEVLEQLVKDTLPKAIEEADLAVLGEPRLHPEGELRWGAPFVYEATVEIRPTIELKRVRGLDLERPTLPQPEGGPVDAYLAGLRSAHGQLVEEPEGTVAARGHVAVIDYEGTCQGRPFEGGSGQEVTLEIGSGRALEGFEESLEGMAVGEERTFDLQFPEDFRTSELAGQPVQFRVRMNGLKRKDLPALDDEFAKDVSEFGSLEALREDIGQKLEQERVREEQRLLREAAAQALVEQNPFPVPPNLVERQLATRIAGVARQLGRAVPEERLRELIERWREEWRPQAEQQVRLALLVPEIARSEGIEISEEDLDEQLRSFAKERDISLTQIRREYQEQGVLEGVRAALLEERVLEFVVAQATVSGS